jgi:FkbM family methyltransferase
MTFISYAQNGEDVVLWRALGHVERGFYIDVGSYDPAEDSVTKAFYDRGWSGINIEPVSALHYSFVQERPRDTNLNVAAAERSGLIQFHVVRESGLSTTVASIAERAAAEGRQVQASTVPALTLASICEEAGVKDIHFLKIDVEGGERAVLEGADFTRFRPWVVVIEATVPGGAERNDDIWKDLLLSSGYKPCLFDGINLFFAAEEHSELVPSLSVPANVLDRFIPARQQAANQRATALETEAGVLKEAVEKHVVLLAEREVALAELQAEAARAQAGAMSRLQAETARAQASAQEVQELQEEATLLRAALAAQEERLQARRFSLLRSFTVPLRALIRLAKGDLPPKEFCRAAFHRSTRVALGLPGMRKAMRALSRATPGPVEWLARRYRIYEERHVMRMQRMPGAPNVPPVLPQWVSVPADLSQQETRFCHLIALARR